MNKCEGIELVELHKLIPHPKNPNKHPKEQIERLVKVIDYQGFRNPIVVSKLSGFVVAGHGRIEAAKILKIEKVPVIFQDFENEAMEYAHLNADNALALWAELDLGQINQDFLDLGPELDIEMFGIKDFSVETPVFEPVGLDEQGKLDELDPKWVQCPSCNNKFNSRLHETNA